MQYIERVRGYAAQMPIAEAVERTITECIKEGILEDFLKQNRAEAIKVSIYEYNEELHLVTVRREGYEDGLENGISQGIVQGITQGITQSILTVLEELGDVSDELRTLIVQQTDEETLRKWLRIAARSETVEAFEMGILKK